MIGDSLSAGPFGEAVQQHLARKYGPQNVAAFASCGSSPEHWLASEPAFYTKCGYRESTPDRPPVLRNSVKGGSPRATRTPKLETLVRRYQPTVVVVQLGTNWMDRNLTDAQISSFADRFVKACRSRSVRQIIWIAPPDHSALRRTQGRVHRLIQAAARRDDFEVIDSRQLTHYVAGKTGGDGVHYNSESSRAWAARINQALDMRLRGRIASR
ncbi:MAG: SGNH/GDSL hydrolase family protein [Chthoniobacterales bacterium]